MFVALDANAKRTDIKRGGVTKTTETTISAANFALADGGGKQGYGHIQYATEVLDAGTYQYDLVNTSGAAMGFEGSLMKIVAVTF